MDSSDVRDLTSGDDIDIDEDEGAKLTQSLGTLRCVDWICKRITSLAGLPDGHEIEEETRYVMVDFLTNSQENALLAYMQDGSLTIQMQLPQDVVPNELCYFVKDIAGIDRHGNVTPENIASVIVHGKVKGAQMEGLLSIMQNFFVGDFRANHTWPETFKKEFSAQLNRFMSSLTEAVHSARGQTVLYIPDEDLGSIEVAAASKDLVQRLESTIIHWTRQIKAIVSNQEGSEQADEASPLVEIENWKDRLRDLSGIQEQLKQPGVERILAVLRIAKSSYLGPFESLAQSIERGCEESDDCLRMLTPLKEPCTQLSASSLDDVPAVLSKIALVVRFVWDYSRFYNTSERISGLLRRVSNQVMEHCSSFVKMSDVAFGPLQQAEETLEKCALCGESWRKAFSKTKAAIALNQSRPGWDSFDESRIFAQLDAFVQRCRDLLEICAWRAQFGGLKWNLNEDEELLIREYETLCNTEGIEEEVLAQKKANLPQIAQVHFGGCRGAEFEQSMQVICDQFNSSIKTLTKLPYHVLDVKSSGWHDDFNVLKSAIKDLEVMFQNVMQNAFDSVGSVAAAADVQETFHQLAVRETILRASEKRASETLQLFLRSLQAARMEYDRGRRQPPLGPVMPVLSGAAMWARTIQTRISKDWDRVSQSWHVTQQPEFPEAKTQFSQVSQAIDDYVKKLYSDWLASLEKGFGDGLDRHLMLRIEGGELNMNFSQEILALYREVETWEHLGFNIPFVAMEACANKDQMRITREQVMIVVREYNRIVASLEDWERRLFSDKIRTLDRKIMTGVTKLSWTSKGVVEMFCRDASRLCSSVFAVVEQFKACKARVMNSARQISETSLVLIERKVLYQEGQFESKQKEHREAVKSRLQEMSSTMHSTYKTMFKLFANDSNEVLREWSKFMTRMDNMYEEALRASVKRSLHDIARAIKGDKRHEVQPIFRVNIILDQSNRIDFKPTMSSLTQMVNTVSKDLITVLSSFSRFHHRIELEFREEQLLTDPDNERIRADILRRREKIAIATEHESETSIYANVSNDEEVLKVMVAIMSGMSDAVDQMSQVLTSWDNKYKKIWDTDREAYIRRFMRNQRPLQSFEKEISDYKSQQRAVQQEKTVEVKRFISSDASQLKQSIVNHCVAWQQKFTSLLNQMARDNLQNLKKFFSSNTESLRIEPANLDELADSVSLLRSLQDKKEATESQFEPLQAQYRLLEQFEVSVADAELADLAALPNDWNDFQRMLGSVEKRLDVAKRDMRKELERSIGTFERDLHALYDEFKDMAPYYMPEGMTALKAVDKVVYFRDKVRKSESSEANLNKGLAIFDLDAPTHKEITQMNRDLEFMEQIWAMVDEWDKHWQAAKTDPFARISVDSLEESAGRFTKRLMKIGRDIKGWGVWSGLKERVDKFKAMIPLISDLRNQALRPRHWRQLMDEVGQDFQYEGDSFTLEVIFKLKLDEFAETIGGISNSASKELMIEEGLQKIEATWAEVIIDAVAYKDRGHRKIRGADDVFMVLDDNSVTLSTMKGTPYHLAFADTIEKWELKLSHVSETLEQMLAVQKQWMYLENIFVGSEDIRRQLPAESKMFDQVDDTWKQSMTTVAMDNNALRACHSPGMLDSMQDTNARLEKIQKCLDEYLETKRVAFPRFYFLSNDDLLEILGQARDPTAVQPHLKKCFEAIKALKFEQNARKLNEAHGMHSPENEYVFFQQPVLTEGAVEIWLVEIEKAMRLSISKLLGQCTAAVKGGSRQKWVTDWAGQLLISAGQIHWTTDTEKALADVERGNKGSMRQLRKKWLSLLNKYTEMVRGTLSPLDRIKVVAIITIEVHARDVLDRLAKAGVSSPSHFDWTSQLRFYWDKASDGCIVKQTRSVFNYGCEYLGNSGRLVITPLTDRCYMTLTTALHLKRGGNPQGPAGTGKTETVKDLGKAIAKYVIVFNCSDGLDFKSMGRMFSGLAQTGAWSCFDEFNRIDIEVLSVVAQQILSILNGITQGLTTFNFEGKTIRLDHGCGIFVTMNPGYAGRTELPDNLKALLRPISMMVPDAALIAEIMLFSEGFTAAKILSKKLTLLYQLMIQQLSKQDHYDFGLRAIKSALNAAGALKRKDPDMQEDIILFRTLRDMNVPKLVAEDSPLFASLLNDFFPGIDMQAVDYGNLQTAIEEELTANNLQLDPFIIKKTIQVFETKATRHGNMLVGGTGSGKSTAWKTLQRAMIRLKKQGAEGFEDVKTYIINPKSLSLGEMFGEIDLSTNEWTDGVCSRCMRDACADEKPTQKWLILDGPVDTLWIESMNTVLDDNKMLTLVSGERISMPPQVSLLFEVLDLSVASPATVSRAGMVYFDVQNFTWEPFVESWLNSREPGDMTEKLRALFQRVVPRVLEVRSECREPVPISDLVAVKSLCNALDVFLNSSNLGEGDEQTRMQEMWFMFCCVFTLGGAVDEDGRLKIDMAVREQDATFPSKNSVYEYFPSIKKKEWAAWEDKISAGWRPLPGTPFYKILVPTVDTVRNDFFVSSLLAGNKHVLVIGETGTGKTALLQKILSNPDAKYLSMTTQFSARTSSNRVQDVIEGRVEKRTKDVWGPPGGKRMVCLVDDMNMPAYDTFGSQPPLELLRHWLDYGFWYDRQKQNLRNVKDIQLLGCMGHPGGGKTVITPRLVSRFNMINFTFPKDSQVKRIFSVPLNLKLADFDDSVKSCVDAVTTTVIDVYQSVVAKMLPTPSRSHYIFSLREVCKVLEGLMRATPKAYDSREQFAKLFVHEMYRIFNDRLVDDDDRDAFSKIVEDKISTHLDMSLKNLFDSGTVKGEVSLFADFLKESEVPVPEEVAAPDLKAFFETKLEEYNFEPGFVAMHLVLFKDAISHLTRIARILRIPRNAALLVGVGGSGRSSLTRLAAYVLEYKIFSIEITKQYKSNEFHEDLKTLYNKSGAEKQHQVFLFSDTQIVEESFVEDINAMLSSGEVPNLFAADELQGVRESVRNDAKKAGAPETPDGLYSFFIDRAREHIHIVLAFSPVGDAFRNRCRQFPSLVSSTTIDWFSDWPSEALQEVATRFTEDLDLGGKEISQAVTQVMAVAHSSVSTVSTKMLLELRRHNYVTPTNFLELVTGYLALLKEKRSEVNDRIFKLRNGLDKLEEAKAQVEEMSIRLEDKKKDVIKAQKECEELLVVIVQERRVAEEQEKVVSADAEKIGKEAAAVQSVADAAQADLDKAMPALQAATEALDSLNKNDITEVKAYAKPPDAVVLTMNAVLTLRKAPSLDWAEAQKQLANANFLTSLKEFDKDKISDALIKKVEKYVKNPAFDPEKVGKVSKAAKSLCMWVIAMHSYALVAKTVAPKREKVRTAMMQLEKKQSSLRKAQAALKEVQDKVAELKAQYDESVSTKERLKAESDMLEAKLERAEALVGGLAGERTRWEGSIGNLEIDLKNTVGDCMIAAAFLSYAGPFNADYRAILVSDTWMPAIQKLKIPQTAGFALHTFLATPTDVRDWGLQGLPSDSFSVENGVLVTRGRRWPLMVDPQGQANKWIKKLGAEKGIKEVDFKMADWMRQMENAIQFGTPVLMQDIGEEIDPSLEPVLSKAISKKGNRLVLKLGDKELDYNPDFRFYLTTKLPNPHYPPEVSTKTTIVNFAIKQQGLEDQLLSIVVLEERRDLEDKKQELVVRVAKGKNKLDELEDTILRLLSQAQGSLLDDDELVKTLQSSKVTAEEVTEQLRVAEETEKSIDAARETYRPAAFRASLLYFVLNDLSSVDPMYQFSLDAYVVLFLKSIEKSAKSDVLEERLENLGSYHTLSVFRNTCLGLFEKHKLLFSLQICVKIMEGAKKINMQEWAFFLRGGLALDRDAQVPNPAPSWISEAAWDNITEADSKLQGFRDLVSSFEQNTSDWEDWFSSASPESTPLPGDWDSKLNELQRLIVLRSLRMDRVVFAATTFITNNLGLKYVEPPPFDLAQIFAESSNTTPLIFVLSPGVDPVQGLQALAEKVGMQGCLRSLALGQGQAPIADRLLQEGMQQGLWVFLANCHLMLSWMPVLEKVVESLASKKPHPNFRLWLSSSPTKGFPISILQTSQKMTSEPPRGLRANMSRLYSKITEEQFGRCTRPTYYKKLLFSLCYFHAVLVERRKFGTLGMAVPYDFNESDFDISENVLALYLDANEEVPWEALRYLIAEANYGGRVTDEWDFRMVRTYIKSFVCEDAVMQERYKLSMLDTYVVPEDGSLQSYKDFVNGLPQVDDPEAFGQHSNADISAQISETNAILSTLSGLMPQSSSGAGMSREDKVYNLAESLMDSVPEDIDYEGTKAAKEDDPSALNVFLLQEIERYNKLLKVMRASLVGVRKGIKGLVVMSSELDEVFECLDAGTVPPTWGKSYPSLKPLGSWMRDMRDRIDHLRSWAEGGYPKVYWASGFGFPTGFVTALLQTAARKNNVSVDVLSWEFIVINSDEKDIKTGPRDGAYISGLFLEGASWDHEGGCLSDAKRMELVVPMPIIHLKPVESKKKQQKGMYQCPCYYYPVRTGSRERPSFIIAIDLKCGSFETDHWVKRGTALLMSLAT